MAYHVLTHPKRPNRQRRIKAGWSWTGFFWWWTGLPMLLRGHYWLAIAVYTGSFLVWGTSTLIYERLGLSALYYWASALGWVSFAVFGMFGVRLNEWSKRRLIRHGWTDEGLTLTNRDQRRQKKAAEHTTRKAERRERAEQVMAAIEAGEAPATVAERHGISERRIRAIVRRGKAHW